MPIKKLYVCDFCGSETTTPNDNWHRLAPANKDGYGGPSGMVPADVKILCNACIDHLEHRFDKK